MPIYAYKCGSCGHAKDVLQKISAAPLTTCPACGAEAFTKQVTAAGFRLKGSGWYATDFRNNGTAPAGSGDASADATKGTPSAAAAKGDHSPDTSKPAHAGKPAPASKPAHAGTGDAVAASKPDAPVASAGASCACH